MPESKPLSDSGPLASGPFHLPDPTRWELLGLLGIDRQGNLDDDLNLQNRLRDVEILLGNYNLDVWLLDKHPTPAQFRDQIKPIVEKSNQLLSVLREFDKLTNELTRELFASWLSQDGAPRIDEIKSTLESLRATASKIVAYSDETESRGRPTKLALPSLISGLRVVFAREYRGSSNTERQRVGSMEHLSERENDEREFVKLSLDAAGIEHPKDLGAFFSESAIAPASAAVEGAKVPPEKSS